MNTKMAAMKVDLSSFVPVIPEIPSLQGDLLKLGDITSAGGLASKIAELKTSMGSVVPDFDSLISGLGLDSFPPSIDSSSICETMPNVEIIDDEPVVAPKESKIPEEEPKKPEPKPVIEPDNEELNKLILKRAMNVAKLQIEHAAGQLNPKGRKKKRMKIRGDFYIYTLVERFIEVYEAGGSTLDDMKNGDYTTKGLRELQDNLKKAHPEIDWDFKAKGHVVGKEYDIQKKIYKNFQTADDFTTAATQAVARRKKKIG